jgi:hypothetical protein
MPYNQGDLVTLKNPVALPDGSELRHPVLIINSKRTGYEAYYTGVMMTGTPKNDRYSFKCENQMFTTPLGKDNCEFRTYLIFGFNETDISALKSTMKKPHLTGLINHIKDHIFKID